MNAELLTILRCPCDPNVTLEHRETGFVCTRCRVEFPIRDQVPCFLIEEATLPEGTRRIADLPCRKAEKSV